MIQRLGFVDEICVLLCRYEISTLLGNDGRVHGAP